MKVEKLESFLSEIHAQPSWREEANKAADYYDGNQLSSRTLQDMEERGIPPIVVNVIKPTVDTVLGMEAKARRDWVVRGERDEDTDLAEALTVKLSEAERVTRANRACADAYEDQVKVGLGWVHIGRGSDPFEQDHIVETVHRSEVHADWRARKFDLSDARYLVRERWYDLDEAVALFPQKKSVLRAAVNAEPWWDWRQEISLDRARDYEIDRDFAIDEDYWRDSQRQRIKLYEVWYRVWTSGKVLKIAGEGGKTAKVVEFDDNNPRHVAAVNRGLAKVERARFSRVRLAWWAGPHRMHDGPSPYPHNRFPYVAFFGYREDLTNTPYGLVRSMMSPQDEINARRSKMLWLLSASRVIADSDATQDPPGKVADEVSRPDSYVVLNPDRRNANGFQIQDGAQLSNMQYQVLQESKSNIQETSGIYGEAKGDADASQSGVAIRELVDRSATTLGKINDNYAESRRLVGELLLQLIVEDIGDAQEQVRVPAERTQNRQEKTVVINGREAGDDGEQRNNRPQRLINNVALDEAPSSSTYRQQYAQQLMEMTKTLPPELQAAVADMVVEASDLPNRQDVADRIRRMTGQGQGAQDQQQAQQQAQQAKEQLEMEKLKGEAAKAQADAQKAQADAEQAQVGIDKQRAETAHTLAQTHETMAETERDDTAQDLELAEEIAALARGETPQRMQDTGAAEPQQGEAPVSGGAPTGPPQRRPTPTP